MVLEEDGTNIRHHGVTYREIRCAGNKSDNVDNKVAARSQRGRGKREWTVQVALHHKWYRNQSLCWGSCDCSREYFHKPNGQFRGVDLPLVDKQKVNISWIWITLSSFYIFVIILMLKIMFCMSTCWSTLVRIIGYVTPLLLLLLS